MKRHSWLVAGLMALLVAGSAIAQDAEKPKRKRSEKKARPAAKPKAPARKPGGVSVETLTEVCKLTDEQKAQVAEKIKAKEDALKAWDEGAKGVQLKELAQKRKDVPKENKEEAAKLSKEMKDIQAERSKMDKELTDAIFAVLTPEQKQLWEGAQLANRVSGQYRRLDLTDDQKAKIQALCVEAIKAAAAPPAVEPDKKGKRPRGPKGPDTKALQAKIESEVLTVEQQEKLKQARQPREKKPKPERKKAVSGDD